MDILGFIYKQLHKTKLYQIEKHSRWEEGHFWIYCVTDFSWRDAKHTSIPTYTSPTPTHTNLHIYTYAHLLTTENRSAKPKVITYNIQFDERFLLGVNKKCRWGLLARSSDSSNVAASLLSSPENFNHGTPDAIDRQLQGSNISFFLQKPSHCLLSFICLKWTLKSPLEKYSWHYRLSILQLETPAKWEETEITSLENEERLQKHKLNRNWVPWFTL